MLLRQSVPKIQPHMCISLNKTNRIRLIVSSTDISEEAELRLTSRLNETIKNYWVALGKNEAKINKTELRCKNSRLLLVVGWMLVEARNDHSFQPPGDQMKGNVC